MNAAQQRILTAAEAIMGTTGNVMRPAQAAKLARWGLSCDPVSQMPAADILTISRMFAGDFPKTMNEADIAEFHRIDQLFEEACQ